MKLQVITLVFVTFIPLVATADVDCDSLGQRADQVAEIVPQMGSGRDIEGKARLPFYSAPDLRCKIRGLFVVPGDMLFAQLEYKGFTKVAFIAIRKTDKKDVVGWVVSSRLKENGEGIVPGRH